MVRASIPAALTLAAGSVTDALSATRAANYTAASNATRAAVPSEQSASAFKLAPSEQEAHPGLEPRTCRVFTVTKTSHHSITAYSFATPTGKGSAGSTALSTVSTVRDLDREDATGAIEPVETEGAFGDVGDQPHRIRKAGCISHYTVFVDGPAETLATVVESPVPEHTTPTAAPVTTHDGKPYEPVTTVLKGNANRVRPGFW